MSEPTPIKTSDGGLETSGDIEQLPQEDTLLDRGVEDNLDEGYNPPDRDPVSQMGGLDPDDPVAQQLAAEQPEVWDSPAGQAAGESQPDRAPRLEDIDDGGRETDVIAGDAGIAGGAASAEEAAVHLEPAGDDDLGVDGDGDGDDRDPAVDVFTEPEGDDDLGVDGDDLDPAVDVFTEPEGDDDLGVDGDDLDPAVDVFTEPEPDADLP